MLHIQSRVTLLLSCVYGCYSITCCESTYGCEASNFVSEPLGLNYCYFFSYPLVGVKVKRQSIVILLDNNPGSLFDCFRTDATLHNKLLFESEQDSFGQSIYSWASRQQQEREEVEGMYQNQGRLTMLSGH